MPEDKLASFIKSTIFAYSNQFFILFITMLYTFVVANALGPENYGIFLYITLFLSNLIYLFGLEVFSSTLSVFTPKYKSKLLFSKLMNYQYIAAIFLFILFFAFPTIMFSFVLKGTPSLLQLFSLLLLVLPASVFYNQLFKGFKMFGKVLKISIMENLTNLSFVVFFIYVLGFGIEGVFYAKVISLILAILVSRYYEKSIAFENKNYENKELIEYNRDIFVVSFIRRIQAQVNLLYIGLFINPVMLGLYYFIDKIFSYALRIPEGAINEVFIPFMGEKHRDKKVFSSYLSINLKASMLVNVLIIFAVVIIVPCLILLFFPAYSDALFLIPLFALMRILPFGDPLNNSYRILGKTSYIMVLSSVSFVVTIVLGYFFISAYGILGIIYTELVKKVIGFFIHLYYVKKTGLKVTVFPQKSDIVLCKRIFAKITNKVSYSK